MWGYFVLVITLPSLVVSQASHCYRCFGSSWCNNFTDPAFGSNVDIVECPITTNLDYKGDNLFTESLLNSLRGVAEAITGADTYDGSLVGCVTATVHEAHEDHTVRVCMPQASIICPAIRNAVLSAVNDISPDVRFSCEGCTEGLCNTHTFVENNVSTTPSPTTESSSPTPSSSNTPSPSTTETSPPISESSSSSTASSSTTSEASTPASESSPISSTSSSTTSDVSPTSESSSSSAIPSSSTTDTSPPTSESSSSSTTSSSTTSEASTSASESSPISSTSSSTTSEASPATSSSQSPSSSTESSPATTESPPNSNQTSTSTTSEPSPTPDEVPLTTDLTPTTNESELDEGATTPSPGAGHTVAISHIIALFVLILEIWVM